MINARASAIGLLMTLAGLLPPSANAEILYVDDDAPPGGDGLTWATAYDDLQDALSDASATGTITEIRVAGGTYTPSLQAEPGISRTETFQLLDSVAISGGYAGLADPAEFEARDLALYESTLSGDLAGDDVGGLFDESRNENAYHVVTGSGAVETAVLEGFTITGGNAYGSGENSSGAGVYNAGGNPTLIHCTLRGNSAECGGGMFNDDDSAPTLTNCRFADNTAIDGGGMYSDRLSSPTLTNCTISRNGGGGMYNSRISSPTLTNCTISGNGGGGMYNWGYSSPTLTHCTISGNDGGGMTNSFFSRPTLTHCTFRGNWAESGGGGIINSYSSPTLANCAFTGNVTALYGGGMYNEYSRPTLTNCTFTENVARIDGGGVYNDDSSSPTLISCAFSGNLAYDEGNGGGMCNADNSSPMLIHCTFTGNMADDDGGGVYNDYNSSPTLTNCTFNGNDANAGGGMYNGGSPTLTNCTFIGNAAYRGGGISNGGSLTMANCILWGTYEGIHNEGESTTLVAYSNIEGGWPGEGNIDLDPLLTPDGHLQAGSPCIQTGNNSLLPPDTLDLDHDGDTSEPIPFDIDGDPRLSDLNVDMGSDEYVDADGDGLPDWWEQRYFGSATIADPNDDPDGDGLSNLQEHIEYSTTPIAPPYYVDAASGEDTFDGSAPAPEGEGVGPKRTIQAALDLADSGDTVLVAAGYYFGDGNRELDYHGRSVVVRAPDGPGSATIDCEGLGSAVSGWWWPLSFAMLEGFTIRDGHAGEGGAISNYHGRILVKDCVLVDNEATCRGGGLYAGSSNPTFADLVIQANTAPEGDAGYLRRSQVNLLGELTIEVGTLDAVSCDFYGPGAIDLGSDGRLHVTGEHPDDPPTVIRTDVTGTGDIHIALGHGLYIKDGAVVDLSGGDPGSGCADPSDSGEWGTVIINGGLVVQNATIQNTNVEVALAEFEGRTEIINNHITLLEYAAGFGGEFFAGAGATIRCNYIVSYGDRYLDLDPAPGVPPGERLIFEDNKIEVIITQGAGGEQGELLELRSPDLDCDPDVNSNGCPSGAFQVCDSEGYSGTWALAKLQVRSGAKVSLTNRDGMVFQDPGTLTPETIYVKKLVLHPDAVLNTALQRMYYQQLVDENDVPIDPTQPHPNGSRIVDEPLLGFSLKIIDMEDDEEFDVRIRRRLRDPTDVHPCTCDGTCPDRDEPEPLTCMEGSITREDGLMPPDSANGVMDMRTAAPGHPSASSVAAKGAFARAGDEEIVISFEYLFVENPDAELVEDPNAELIVYLSDDPDVGEGLVEVARLRPPAPGRPGSIGRDEPALFYGAFPPGDLHFTRGTYVELELRGRYARVWIDNWDPQIACLACADLDGTTTVDNADFLLLLAEYGQTLEEAGYDNWCLDTGLSGDHYVDFADLLALDVFLDNGALNACGTGMGDGAGRTGGTRGGRAPEVTVSAFSGLLIAGKPDGAGMQEDFLYPVNFDGSQGGSPQFPASMPRHERYRGNGRLVQDAAGALYQIHAAQGLVRLHDGQVVLAPGSQPFEDDETIHVGMNETGGGDFIGLPLADVAFHPGDCSMVYVVPVLVETTFGCPYKAAAKLQLYGDGSFTVQNLYGLNPETDPEVTITPVDGCEVVLEPDLQRLREIEVDAQRNVFVLSAQAVNDNDWVLIYDEAAGTDPEQRVLVSVSGTVTVRGPTAMHVARSGDDLLLAFSISDAALLNGRSRLFRFAIERSGSEATGLTPPDYIDIINPTHGDHGFGHVATIRSVVEDPDDGTLYVTGFTMPRFDPETPYGDPAFDPLSGAIPTTPTLAAIREWTGPPVTAVEIDCADLALPVSAVFVRAVPGDCDGDGDVDLRDFKCVAGCLAGPGSEPPADCELLDLDGGLLDLDGDADVDLLDFATFQQTFTGPACAD